MDEISDLLRARIDYFLKSPFEIRRNNVCEVHRIRRVSINSRCLFINLLNHLIISP